jgi:outer membrane protein OmpA-like peptidoglycan-associated protein
MNKIMRVKIIFLLIILSLLTTNEADCQIFFQNFSSQGQNNQQFDEFIKKNAPSDNALQLVIQMANMYLMGQQYQNAMNTFLTYKEYFPARENFFKDQIRQIEQNFIAYSPTPDMIDTYDKYVRMTAPKEEAFVAVQRMSERYIMNKDWDSAAAVFKDYMPLFPVMATRFKNIIDLLEADELGLEIHNLGQYLNTKYNEYDPCPTPDSKFMYFTSLRPGGLGGEDVWTAKNINGIWQKVMNLGKAVNGPGSETVDNVTADGNSLILSGNFNGSYGLFDIYSISATSDGWGSLEHFPMPINSKYHDEAGYMTADGKAIIFDSDRPGGIGGYIPRNSVNHGSLNGNLDIYVCIKTDSGWSDPINLGPKINTPYAERSAYLHPDGKTLYFSSEGHYGLGGLDVFKAVRLREDSWTEWSDPVNLGKEINTSTDDWGYKICLSGDSAIFAGLNRPGGMGGWDIYSVTLPKEVRPEEVITISGKVTGSHGEPLEAEIKWEDLSTGKNVGVLKSNPLDGTYIIPLPKGKLYGYFAEKEGYYPTSNNIDLRKQISETTIIRDIVLVSAREMRDKSAKININNIFFDFDKFELKPESYPELDRLAEFLKSNSASKVHIDGHTDNVGEEKYNKELSHKRANSVVEYITQKSLSRKLFTIEGFGASKPIADNATEEGRAKNRRVEIWFEK